MGIFTNIGAWMDKGIDLAKAKAPGLIEQAKVGLKNAHDIGKAAFEAAKAKAAEQTQNEIVKDEEDGI